MRFLQCARVRLWGFFLLGMAVGAAVANGWATHEALQGSGRWWQQYCHQRVLLQQQLDNQ